MAPNILTTTLILLCVATREAFAEEIDICLGGTECNCYGISGDLFGLCALTWLAIVLVLMIIIGLCLCVAGTRQPGGYGFMAPLLGGPAVNSTMSSPTNAPIMTGPGSAADTSIYRCHDAPEMCCLGLSCPYVLFAQVSVLAVRLSATPSARPSALQ